MGVVEGKCLDILVCIEPASKEVMSLSAYQPMTYALPKFIFRRERLVCSP